MKSDDFQQSVDQRLTPLREAKRAGFEPSEPGTVRPGFTLAAYAILAFLFFGNGYFDWDKWWNQRLYIDNALDRRVDVDLDGERFRINAGGFEQKELQAGHHAIVVREVSGKEIEKRQFDIERMSLFGSMAHDHFFV